MVMPSVGLPQQTQLPGLVSQALGVPTAASSPFGAGGGFPPLGQFVGVGSNQVFSQFGLPMQPQASPFPMTGSPAQFGVGLQSPVFGQQASPFPMTGSPAQFGVGLQSPVFGQQPVAAAQPMALPMAGLSTVGIPQPQAAVASPQPADSSGMLMQLMTSMMGMMSMMLQILGGQQAGGGAASTTTTTTTVPAPTPGVVTGGGGY